MTKPIADSNIAAQAFRLLELDPVTSYGEDTEQARAAEQAFGRARDLVLESYDWSAAREIATLPPHQPQAGEATDPDLPHVVRLPEDCVALRHIYESHLFAWRLDGRMIRLTREPPVTVRYTRRITREAALPQAIQLLIAYQLAFLLAPRFLTTRTKREQIRDEMRDAAQLARRNDAVSASAHRLDGTADVGDWASEATR